MCMVGLLRRLVPVVKSEMDKARQAEELMYAVTVRHSTAQLRRAKISGGSLPPYYYNDCIWDTFS